MAWQTEMSRILRHLINDLSATPTFSDSRLEELLLVAAQIVQDDVNFTQDYTIDVDATSLSPDPTTGDRDNAFINLVVLKSRCILAESQFRVEAQYEGISVRDGQSNITKSGGAALYRQMWQLACEDYDKAKWEYKLGSLNPGRAVLTPFSSPEMISRIRNP